MLESRLSGQMEVDNQTNKHTDFVPDFLAYNIGNISHYIENSLEIVQNTNVICLSLNVLWFSYLVILKIFKMSCGT